MELIPNGYNEGDLPMNIIDTFTHEGRKLATTSFGHNVGVFDVLTGGKIYSFFALYTMSFNEACKLAKEKALTVISQNKDWIEVLDKLPYINTLKP